MAPSIARMAFSSIISKSEVQPGIPGAKLSEQQLSSEEEEERSVDLVA